jgi:hypothetical protein
MAKTVFSVSAELRLDGFYRALEITKTWPVDKRFRFHAEWQALVKAGAEFVEVKYVGGRIVAYPSEELSRHMAKWGLIDFQA